MKKIKINTFKLPEELIIEVKDLRNNNHPEFENYNDIEFHINEAIKQNGLRYYEKSVFNTVYKKELTNKSISFTHHLYHLYRRSKRNY
ncbi:MAG: hypothetical protein A2X08_03175 [Bacteroidetes bacterium GWA2_32_17]|nr:MAG: hypothetical protein A2X08_03175 [Bacteroidetes bacterium GWA2_32_17]